MKTIFYLLQNLKIRTAINVPIYIEEGAICNRVYLTTNNIATVFGRDDFRKYINEQIKNRNLVRIKNKSNAFSEGDVAIAPAYKSIAFSNSILNKESAVNNNFTQDKAEYTENGQNSIVTL